MDYSRTDESKTLKRQSLLKACCDLEYLLIGDLRTMLSENPKAQSRASLLFLLDRLIQTLPNVLKLSSEDGYLKSVVERRPNWSRQVNDLFQSNVDCVSSLRLVRNCLEDDGSCAAISEDLEVQLQNWIKSFSAIRSLENSIVQEAFTVDLGGEA